MAVVPSLFVFLHARMSVRMRRLVSVNMATRRYVAMAHPGMNMTRVAVVVRCVDKIRRQRTWPADRRRRAVTMHTGATEIKAHMHTSLGTGAQHHKQCQQRKQKSMEA